MRRLITSPKQAAVRPSLLSLFNAYDANPTANYSILIEGGFARGLVEQNDQCESEYTNGEDYNSYQYEEVSIKRGVGLFANIIRNMEIRKQQQEVKEVVKPTVKEYKEYQFYYPKNILGNCTNQAKKIEGPKSNPFITIEVVQPDFPSKVEAAQEVLSKRKTNKQEKAEMVGQMIDLNFSFDQISQNIQDMRCSRPQEDTIIKRYIKGNQENEEVKHKTEQSLPIKKLSNSKENEKNVEITPTEERLSIQINHSSKILSEKSLKVPSEPILPASPHAKYNFAPQNSLYVQGTKRAQSRIFNTRIEKAADIRIDFDLDLDFI